RHDGEFEREARAVLAQAGNGEEIALAVTAAAGGDELSVAAPVTRAQPLGNDEVEGPAERLVLHIVENALRARGPEADDAVAIGGDDRVRLGRENGLRETLGNIHRRLRLPMPNAQIAGEFAAAVQRGAGIML